MKRKLESHDHEYSRCPQCNCPTNIGYGLAGGGGLGTYTYCTNDACDYFSKVLDVEDLDDDK